MALDGVFSHYLIKELNNNLSNNRVEEIYFNDNIFVLKLYYQKVRSYLHINLNASFVGAYLSKKNIIKGPSNIFLDVLKRNLEGSILNNITQYESDRIFIFNFTYYDFVRGPIKKELVFEAMGKYANLILIEDGYIIDVYKRNFNPEGRMLIPKAKFKHFLSDKENAFNYQKNSCSSPKEITDKYLGISLRLAKYLYNNNLNLDELPFSPTLSLDSNKAYFFNIFEGNIKSFNTLSEAIDNKKLITKDLKSPYFTFINNYLKKLDKKRVNLTRQKEKSIKLLDDKEKADLIYASGLNLKVKIPHLNNIKLDETITLNQNAQKFYKNYHKGKRGIAFIEDELINLDNEYSIISLYKEELILTKDDDVNDFNLLLNPYGFNKKVKKNKPNKNKVLMITNLDATYYVGKNAHQNGYIVNEIGKPNDYWFHIKDAPGAHVLVKTNNLTEDIIRKASILAGYFSKFKDSSSIPINYTLFKNVKKMTGFPPSMVKISHEKTIFIDIDENEVNLWLENA